MVYELYGLTEEEIKIVENVWTGILWINEIMEFF